MAFARPDSALALPPGLRLGARDIARAALETELRGWERVPERHLSVEVQPWDFFRARTGGMHPKATPLPGVATKRVQLERIDPKVGCSCRIRVQNSSPLNQLCIL